MQPEKSVKVDYRIARDVDRRPHRVISLLAVGDYDIESVGGAALEDDNQALVLEAERLNRMSGAGKESWNRSGTHDSKATVAKKYTASDWHKNSS